MSWIEEKKINIQKFIYGCNHIINYHSDDLLTRKNKATKPDNNLLWGKCYFVSEAIYYSRGGKDSGYKPMNMRHENTSHWFILGPMGAVIDLTAKQYFCIPNYQKAKGRGFLPTEKGISKRGLEFYNRVISHLNFCARFPVNEHSPHLAQLGSSVSKSISCFPPLTVFDHSKSSSIGALKPAFLLPKKLRK